MATRKRKRKHDAVSDPSEDDYQSIREDPPTKKRKINNHIKTSIQKPLRSSSQLAANQTLNEISNNRNINEQIENEEKDTSIINSFISNSEHGKSLDIQQQKFEQTYQHLQLQAATAVQQLQQFQQLHNLPYNIHTLPSTYHQPSIFPLHNLQYNIHTLPSPYHKYQTFNNSNNNSNNNSISNNSNV
eukprot:313862_1